MSNTVSHTVKPGETLSGIASKNGVSLDALMAANPDITNPNLVQVGQIVLIPSSSGSGSNEQSSVGTQPAPGTAPAGTGSSSAGASLNAILDLFQSAGASAKTAKQDHLPGGVASSETMAKTDRTRVMASKEKFKVAARAHNLPPALLAAIASRESRGGAVLKNGFGDGGHGFGLMQVDDRNPFPVQQDGGPGGQPHISQATKILADKLAQVKQKFPGLSAVDQLEMAVSRYNGGAGKQPPNSDQGTTGGDYMNDVWARARFYARVEDWS